ncbi:CoA ester lyase [Paraburkholderia sp. Tr-20389]|uniref:HpcH/HpaI aldolase/citrate lyase family protein n=1 Tax=Paraburkholderia sp. Tr-20389 TaxID=2703903 RepID=UPI00197E85EC|nr:CoA ester lyase [Paraburkholderia sp. Tr-20389]MBN3754345.1 CoA ester lyase [Paraburkholderia sp. Tr-20389]
MKSADNAVTYLFVPGDRPERFAKAVLSGADVVIIDLEDAVAPANKAEARGAILEAWPSLLEIATEHSTSLCIRINGLREKHAKDDLALCHLLRPTLVMVPKVESGAELGVVSREVPSARVLALIETALGVLEARSIAAAPNVAKLILGSVDLMLNLGISDDRDPLDWTRSMLVLSSVAAGIGAPVDGVCTSIEDSARIKADAQRARSFGFGAKLCIHPKQIGAVREAFMVTDEEVSWAKRVIEAAEASAGAATAVDGAMIDIPVLLRAKKIVAQHSDALRFGAD